MGTPCGGGTSQEHLLLAAWPRSSIAAHVYMDVCCCGVTKLMFVAGTHKQASKFVNPKGKRLDIGVWGC